MLIAFTHPFKAFLPEIDAYRRYFQQINIPTVAVHSNQAAAVPATVEWRFMGTQFRKSKAPVVIHEYASASLPPFRRIKDLIKTQLTVTPDFRLFLNPYVRDQFAFRDGIPYGLRDMGIDPSGILSCPGEKKYDFIYCGSVSRDMQIHRLLDCFTRGSLKSKSLLILSKDYDALKKRYSNYENILFTGPVPQHEVAAYIRQSAFTINYKPDIAPHNEQTSTKLLEYAACGVPVITTGFPWMRQFQQQYGGNFFYLQADLSNFEWESVRAFPYANPDLREWTWEKQIRKSGVVEFLQTKFPHVPFDREY